MENTENNLLNHEIDNFNKWFTDTRQWKIGYNYKKIRAKVGGKLRDFSLFPSVQKKETSERDFVEKIFLNDLFEFKNHPLEYIELPTDISDYFWLKALTEFKGDNQKIWQIFKSEARKQNKNNQMKEIFLKKFYKNKYALIRDAVFISAFIHDINVFNDEVSSLDADISIRIAESGKDALNTYKTTIKKSKKKKGIVETDFDLIRKIINEVTLICSHHWVGIDNAIQKLFLHLVPLIIFVIVNLPKNEVLDEESDNAVEKLFSIILVASQDVLTLNSINNFLEDKKVDLFDIQKRFLLVALDSQKSLMRALTKRNPGETTYPDRYNIITYQLKSAAPLGMPGKSYDKTETQEGDYKNLNWLFELHSVAMDSFKKGARDLSPQYGTEIFMKLLDSCEIEINEKPFYFNKTINLVIFNSLTRLIISRSSYHRYAVGYH